MTPRIPFNRACFVGTEQQYIAEAVSNGHISGDGRFTARCEEWFGQRLGSPTLLTTSCTHALEMAALLAEVGPGDEVILPSFTFVSTANAFVLRGATPRFADVTPDTLNLDPDSVEPLLSDRTRAIVPVHYGGVACDLGRLAQQAEGVGAMVIEDNAHGALAKLGDRPLGTIGSLGTLSFHETKNITCGEGGALVINDPSLVERAEILRQKGTNRKQFLRGDVDKYTWVDLGSSYVMSDILAAVLWAQLEGADEIHRQRRLVWEHYHAELAGWAVANDVQLPTIPPGVEQGYHLFYLLLPDSQSRDRLIDHLGERGILAVFHYQPLHLSEMGRRYGGATGDCPVTESVSSRLVRLPFFHDLSNDELGDVVATVRSFTP